MVTNKLSAPSPSPPTALNSSAAARTRGRWLWDTSTGKLVKVLGGNADFVTAVAASPDGSILATATDDGRITLRDARSLKVKGTLRGHAGGITGLAFAPDSATLASSSTDTTVKLWDVASRTEKGSLKGHSKQVNSVAYSPDGTTIATAGEDASVRLWDARTDNQRKTFDTANVPVTGVVYSPDGTTLLEGRGNGTAATRSVATGSVKQTMTLPESASTSAQAASPKGTSSTASAPQGTTAMVEAASLAAAAPLASGPGGPILVVTSSADPFSEYYAEILRAEGLNAFSVADASTVTATTLNGYDVVILAARTLTAAQVTAYSDWVTGGGNLVAMRPDAQLAGLLGLTSAGSTLANGYLKVDTTTRAGNGIVGETIQYHGTADRYTLAGARAIAQLYSNATTATTNPAVTLRSLGTQGGEAAAFTYDLARSVVLTRQGNPSWAGQERDGIAPKRSDDMFYGARAGDVQNDWIDLTKVQIPQADEQQRLLVNLILQMNSDRTPLPRFWYLPRGLKAAVVMTGDDHGNNGTAGRFDSFLAQDPAGCTVADWECIRGTSYIYPDTPLSSAQATSYVNQGFEVGVHVTTRCSDWTPASLANDYTTQLAAFASKYTGVPAPTTSRTHCIAWSDWATQAAVEGSNGIRLDTNYYYWPPSWLQDRPGFFTGSGIPMRFTDTTGAMIDVYQAATQLTDESGQTYPNTVDSLLDGALGPQGYYGAFTINAHTDAATITESTTTVASAKDRGVPVVTAKQMLDWVDARNASSFQNLAWNNGQLSFTVAPGAGARNLDMLVPARSGQWVLSGVTRDGATASYSTRTVKGADYALVRATAGTYTATYAQDTTGPTVESVVPADGATGASQSAAITATFSEQVDPATVSSSTFELRDSGNALVASAVSYDPTTRTAKLTPNASLAAGKQYRATVRGGTADPTIRDTVGNPLAASTTWTFTTANGPSCPCTIWPSSATPVNKVEQDPNAVELGVKFRSDVDGFVTGVRFWKGTQNTGTHVGSLWTTSGQRLANATFSNETSTGWQEVTFGSPVAITANTTYVASYHTTSGYYAGDNNFFTSGVDNPPLHALANSTSANGVYAYGSTPTFPSNTWNASNYWVDVAFTTNTGPDTTPPTVSSTVPADNATDVATNSAVTATFNETLDPTTVTTTTATLTGPGSTAVAATVTYDSASRLVRIQPSSTLTPNTNYTARLKGGTTDPRIKDVAGNALAADKVWTFTTAPPGPCDNPANAIVAENCKPGNPASEWDISGAGDTSIQGYATDISVNRGQTVQFKVDTPSTDYRIDIYRLGYYGGDGARKVATVQPSATLPQAQPKCLQINGTTNDNLIDCGNWAVSASWAVPADAMSGVYIARPVRQDGTNAGAASHIVFIVRDDAGTSDLLFQTSDTTWQAYNGYGGYSLYANPGHAHKVSYNRPFTTRANPTEDWLFNAEYPMIRFLERNGYDVSYFTNVDADRNGALIRNHKTFMSVGHDEYWSKGQRDNVEAARDAGVNLAFFSGNEIYWKTRWEPSTASGTNTDYRTLVSYKEGDAQGSAEHYDCYQNFNCDPHPTSWTGLWRQNQTGHDGGKPENALSGQISWGDQTAAIQVPAADGSLRFWRDASISSATTLAANTLGYEFDWEQPAYASSNPAGRITLSDTTAGGKNHKMSLYRAPSGALVFGAGTVQWSWGLDATHDRGPSPIDPKIQQATVNILADMSAQPRTLQSGLVKATKSADATAPTAVITTPADGSRVDPGAAVTISGTATDAGGGRVGGVEVSTDNGATWQPATGRATWTFIWTAPAGGTWTLKARAIDDSANIQPTPTSATVTVGAGVPNAPTGLTASGSGSGVNLDWADTTGATGYNVYRSDASNGTYTKLTATPVTTSAYADTAAPVGASYYQVTAVNATGESAPSATVTGTRPPAAPTGLNATATSTGISLTWGTTAGATEYNVYRAAASAGPFTKLTATPVTSPAYDDTAAPAGTSYYQVTALAAGAESAPSATVNATRVVPPGAPTGLTATATPTGISLDWADTTGATSYKVSRSDTADGTYTTLTDTLTTSAYTDATAPIGTSYYRVTAANSAGDSPPASVSATRVALPEAPNGLSASATTSGITLDWADGPAGATGYNVYRAATAGGPFTKVNAAAVTASAWDDTMAPAGASVYQVTALGAGGESPPSTQANATMAKAILLANPSFELDANADSRPDSWTSSARFLRTTAGARSGSYGGTHSANNANYTVGQTRTGLTAGTSYTAAGWVNIPATTDAFTFTIQIQWRSSNSLIRTDTVRAFTGATGGWVKVSGTYTAPTGANRAVVNMVASSLRGPVQVDDFTLR